jgi:hypothetical protein
MKQVFFKLAHLLLLALVLLACKKKEPSALSSDKLLLKGRIANNGGRELGNAISKVIIFYQEGYYRTSNVNNDSFSIPVDRNKITFLIFAGTSDEYLGYLSLKNGLEALPILNFSDNIAEIDLKDINIQNNVGTPSHNPLGNEIGLNNEEQNILANFDDYIAPTVRNPDIDNNGKIDILENKIYRLQVLWFYKGGTFGSNLTPNIQLPLSADGWKLAFSSQDENAPNMVNFYFPWASNQGIPSEQITQFPVNTEQGVKNVKVYFPPLITQNLPIGGTYKVNYQGQMFSFIIDDQSNKYNNVPLIVPTLTLTPEGNLQKVSWVYRNSNNSANINPNNIVSRVNFGIMTTSQNINFPNIEMPSNEYVFETNISWNNVNRFWIAYHDLFDNHYIFFYDK